MKLDRRLQQLEENIGELGSIKRNVALSDIKTDKSREWALRYGLLESIQIVIDICCHLVAHHNLGKADTYSDCIRQLARSNILGSSLEQKLRAMAGLRNILIHEYVDIDLNHLYDLLDNLDDFQRFAKIIRSEFS